MDSRNISTYLIALGITGLVFATAVFATNTLANLRIAQLEGIEERIAIDILSLETQFELLAQISCEDLTDRPLLSRELATLGDRLAVTEARIGTDKPEVIRLKKQYSLLQIKDHLLYSRISEQCDLDIVPILYFYANDCTACTRAGYALSVLREEYPQLHVYSFDYDLDLAALQTLATIHGVDRNELPAFVINDVYTSGFSTLEELSLRLPEHLRTATTTVETIEEE